MENIFLLLSEYSLAKPNCLIQNITEIFNYGSEVQGAILITPHNGSYTAELFQTFFKSKLKSRQFTLIETKEEMENFLGNIIVEFEKYYFKQLKEPINEIDKLIPELEDESGATSEAMEKYEECNKKLMCCCTFCAVIYFNGEIFTINVGDNEMIILNADNNFFPFIEKHFIKNENEVKRIVDDCKMSAKVLSNLYAQSYAAYHSRCLGHYDLKKNFKNHEPFRSSNESHLICKPQIKCISSLIAPDSRIIFISSGLYYLVMDLIYDVDKIIGEIANEFVNRTYDDICEKILEKYASNHKKAFQQNMGNFEGYQREELTLMVLQVRNYSKKNTEVSPQHEETTDELNVSNSQMKSVSNEMKSTTSCYINFDKWHEAEKKLTEEEKQEISELLQIKSNKAPAIMEEEEVKSF